MRLIFLGTGGGRFVVFKQIRATGGLGIPVVTRKKKAIKHLSLEDVRKFLSKNKPDTPILTHFGMSMLRIKPWEIAEGLSEDYSVNVIAAMDGMELYV